MGKLPQILQAMREKIMGGGTPPILIGVMGMTGAGKSTFINLLTKDPDIKIGRGLRSCTKLIQPAYLDFTDAGGKQYDVFLVDTPGFDDTEMTDTDVLEELVTWLQLTERNQLKLSGLVYLHRISDNRMTGSATRNLNMMIKLVGDQNLKNVVLVSSRWETVDYNEAEEREQVDLLGPDGFWHTMIKLGASSARYDGTVTKAHEIINRIVHQSPTYLLIQEELRRGMNLNDTAAGQAIITQLEREAMKREKELKEIKEQMQKATENAERNALLLEAQQQRYDELIKKMQRDEKAREKLMKDDKEKLENRIKDLEEKSKNSGGSGGGCFIL